MLQIKSIGLALALSILPLGGRALADQTPRDLVVSAVTDLFIKRDLGAIDRYWAEDYLQHNPMFPSGREVIRGLFGAMPDGFRYEMGLVIAEGDLVAIQGRYSGLGPTPSIVVDIFRVQDGKIAEHWDVGQDEVDQTASGLPMFQPLQ